MRGLTIARSRSEKDIEVLAEASYVLAAVDTAAPF